MPDVTAIVTCMSDAERPFLTETLQSVRNQTVPCETIVVVLESNAWIDEVSEALPGLRVVRRPPGWAGAACNSGVEAVKRSSSPFWTATMSGCPQRRRSKWLF